MMKNSDWLILIVGTTTVLTVMAFIFQSLSH